jgi:hypothetical protein
MQPCTGVPSNIPEEGPPAGVQPAEQTSLPALPAWERVCRPSLDRAPVLADTILPGASSEHPADFRLAAAPLHHSLPPLSTSSIQPVGREEGGEAMSAVKPELAVHGDQSGRTNVTLDHASLAATRSCSEDGRLYAAAGSDQRHIPQYPSSSAMSEDGELKQVLREPARGWAAWVGSLWAENECSGRSGGCWCCGERGGAVPPIDGCGSSGSGEGSSGDDSEEYYAALLLDAAAAADALGEARVGA